MQKMHHNLDARRAKRILTAQAVATLVVTLVGLIFGPREGLFAFIGGATAAAANALFVAGPSDWHRIARQMGVRYVVLTDDQGRVHMNPAMRDRIKLHQADREVIISEPLS